MDHHAKIWLLGPPRFQVANQDVEFGTRKAVALLAYLAVKGQPQSRETLTSMLWPEYDQKSASQAFRQTLYTARRSLGKNLLPGIGKQILLDDSGKVWIDVKEFQMAVDAGSSMDITSKEAIAFLQRAAALYQGDFLAGFTLKDSLEFDDWQLFETHSLKHKYGRVLEALVRYFMAHGLHDQALKHALRQVHLDQLDELAHRNVIQAYAKMGQRVVALRHYDKYEQILARELQIKPSEEIYKLRDMIMAEETTLLPSSPVNGEPVSVQMPPQEREPLLAGNPLEQLAGATAGATAQGSDSSDKSKVPAEPLLPQGNTSPNTSPDAPKNNLPSLATAFVGREPELAMLAELAADPKCRLITILGPGGMGKTRLALEMANQLERLASRRHPRATFANGVWFVELAQIQKVEDIVTTIADVVGFWFQSDQRSPKQQLIDYFKTKNALIILDNFEHLMTGAGIISELIQAAPNIKVVVTSREKLNLYGETAFTLDGLEYPDGESQEDALQYNAVKIFMNSARRVCPGYEPRTEALKYLTTICRQCHGMPLAIELAASWTDVLSLKEITKEITKNLDFLETKLRDVPARQRSVRATFDHSWRLLEDADQSVFVKFAVFRGSFSRKAAQSVTGVSLQQLTKLMDKSFLQRDAESGRYKVHELLRQYAEDELEARGELQSMRHAHSRYYLQALSDLKNDLDGRDQLGALKSIESDIENVRTAAFHAAEFGFHSQLAAALYNLWRFYLIRGQFLLGEGFFAQLASRLRNLPASPGLDQVLGEILAHQSFFYFEHRNIQKAETTLLECESLLKNTSYSWLQVMLAYCRARCFIPFGFAKEARPVLAEAIKVCRQLGDRYLEAHGLHLLSVSYYMQMNERDMAKATMHMEEASRIRQEIDDTMGIAWSLSLLGSYAMTQGEYERGERLTLRGLSLYRRIGNRDAAPHDLGANAAFRAQWDKARRYMEESLAIAKEAGDLNKIAWRLTLLGRIEFYAGDFERAKSFFSEGEAQAKVISNSYWLVKCQNGLATVAMAEGHYRLARQLFTRGLDTRSAEENKFLIPISHRYLGQVARLARDFARAHEHFDQATARFGELEDEDGLIRTQLERAWLYFDEGKMTKARTNVGPILDLLSDDRSAKKVLRPIELMITSIVTHTLVGAIALRSRDHDEASRHFRSALKAGGQNYSVPHMLMFVGRAGEHLHNLCEYQRATEIAAYVANNESAFVYDRQIAESLLPELKSSLSADGYQTAVEEGRCRDLETVLKTLRTEFGVGAEDSE